MRNPIVHMTLWNLIATGGLITVLLLLNSLSPTVRAAMFETVPLFLLGVGFWILVAMVTSVIGGVVTGALVWTLTFSALVSDRTITRYYFQVWIVIGLLLLITNSLVAWWYVANDQWVNFPLTTAPSMRYILLSVVWMVVVPLIGATRFVDTIKADPRRIYRRRKGETE